MNRTYIAGHVIPRSNESPEITEWRRRNPLRRWRAEHNISLTQVARELRVTRTTATNWEEGLHTPSYGRLSRIAKLIGVTEGWTILEIEWEEWRRSRPLDDTLDTKSA